MALPVDGSAKPKPEKRNLVSEAAVVTGADLATVENRKLDERPQQLIKSEPPTLSLLTILGNGKANPELDKIATQPSVYDDPELVNYFLPTDKYENLHRFDPSARWTWREEFSIINKLDWRVTLWAWIAFFALDLDRGNISQANTDNFLDDLGLDTNDFNLGNTVFRMSFFAAELPSQLISKKLGPDLWIPTIMCLWAIVSACQFWLSGRTSFLICRGLIGLLQRGFMPDVILYLTYFFKSTELPFRLAVFWTAVRATDVVAPLLAVGLLRLRGVLGYEGWRWLFLIEGIMTLFIGVWSWFAMVPSPTESKTWYNPKGWFTEREETILVNRILRDDPTKGDMHNRQAVDFKLLWKSLCDYHLWPIYIIGLCFVIPSAPPNQYLTLTLRGMGFSTFHTNILSIPTPVLQTIIMLVSTYYFERWGQRALFGIFAQTWLMAFLLALRLMPDDTAPWAKYAVLSLVVAYPSPHASQVAWCSTNSGSVRTRTVSAALYNMFVQVGNIAAANVYREDDRPNYGRGNMILAIMCGSNIVIYVLTRIYYGWRNKVREHDWSTMSRQEQLNYLETTKDTGSKRREFRFIT